MKYSPAIDLIICFAIKQAQSVQATLGNIINWLTCTRQSICPHPQVAIEQISHGAWQSDGVEIATCKHCGKEIYRQEY